jgi:capsular polysaccharide biosynthesis protein
MENNLTREEQGVDLLKMFQALWGRVWLIVGVAVLVAALVLGYTVFFIAPTYSAKVQLYVNNSFEGNNSGISSSQVAAAQALADTYVVILGSRNVLDDVAEKTGLDYSYLELKDMITGKAVNKTEVIEVTVTCEDYKHAAQIANAIAEVMPEKIAAVVQGSSVRVVDYAVEDSEPVGPSYIISLAIGALLGILITCAWIIIAELTDTSIQSEEYLSETYRDIPLLAVIPGAEVVRSGSKGYYEASPAGRTVNKKEGAK